MDTIALKCAQVFYPRIHANFRYSKANSRRFADGFLTCQKPPRLTAVVPVYEIREFL